MKKLKFGKLLSQPLSREEMKGIVAGSGSCSGSCTFGNGERGDCFTSISGGCGCTAIGIGTAQCSG